MANDLGGDAAYNRVRVVQALEGRLHGGGILPKAAEGLLFAKEKLRAAGAQGVHECQVVTTPCPKEQISTN